MRKLIIFLLAAFAISGLAYSQEGYDGWYMYSTQSCDSDSEIGFTTSIAVVTILWSHGHVQSTRELKNGRIWQCIAGLPLGEYNETS